MVFAISRGTGDQLEDLDCFLNIAYYLVAESLALFLEENNVSMSKAERNLGLSRLEPRGFKRDRSMCEPHALCVWVVCLILSLACLWASCFQRTVASFCKITPSLFDQEFVFLFYPFEFYKEEENACFCLLYQHSKMEK